MFLLPAHAARGAAGMVQEPQLPQPRGARAAPGAREFGPRIPDEVEIRVHDSTADMRYMVLPLRPAGSGRLSEEQLAQLVTRDSLIGVGLPQAA